MCWLRKSCRSCVVRCLIADWISKAAPMPRSKKPAASNIDVLSEEEMLYAATLTDDAAAHLKVLTRLPLPNTTAFAVTTTQVWFGARAGKVSQAKALFEKAAGMSKDAAITNNLGVVALMSGDAAAAQKYFAALNTADSKANMGLVNLAEGKLCRGCQSAERLQPRSR